MIRLLLISILLAVMPSVTLGNGWPVLPGPGINISSGGTTLYDEATVVYDFSDVTDSKGNHDLTNNNSVTFSNTSPPGNRAGDTYAVFVSTSSQTLSAADHTDFDLNGVDFTISFIIKLNTLNRGSVLSKGSGQYAYDFRNVFSGSNIIRVNWVDNWGSSTYDMPANSTSAWRTYTLAYVQATKTITVWVSEGTFGSLVSADTAVVSYDPGDSASDFIIGTANSAYFDGHMAEMVLWKGKALNASEAEAYYDNTWR